MSLWVDAVFVLEFVAALQIEVLSDDRWLAIVHSREPSAVLAGKTRG